MLLLLFISSCFVLRSAIILWSRSYNDDDDIILLVRCGIQNKLCVDDHLYLEIGLYYFDLSVVSWVPDVALATFCEKNVMDLSSHFLAPG
jgi:hypothetical protein